MPLNPFRSLLKRKVSPVSTKEMEGLYREQDYLQAYSQHTDLRVERDPKEAVGGMWEEIGTLQFEFLVRQGLKPEHSMLDIGCGTLRGGRHFIRYLAPERYTGIDISAKAIEYAGQLVREEGLSEKQPRLMVSQNQDLKFAEFAEKFDFILAQSVFTHLHREHIQECFEHVGSVMGPQSAFYFTYNEDASGKGKLKDFGHPYSFFEELAAANGFTLTECSHDYPHPRGQRMACVRKTA